MIDGLAGIAVAVILVALVAGTAYQVLRGLFKQRRDAQDRDQATRRPTATRSRPHEFRDSQRPPERTRLRWYSAEIVAVLLLALAAGLWLARLTG